MHYARQGTRTVSVSYFAACKRQVLGNQNVADLAGLFTQERGSWLRLTPQSGCIWRFRVWLCLGAVDNARTFSPMFMRLWQRLHLHLSPMRVLIRIAILYSFMACFLPIAVFGLILHVTGSRLNHLK